MCREYWLNRVVRECFSMFDLDNDENDRSISSSTQWFRNVGVFSDRKPTANRIVRLIIADFCY